jgi:hypothetical protein
LASSRWAVQVFQVRQKSSHEELSPGSWTPKRGDWRSTSLQRFCTVAEVLGERRIVIGRAETAVRLPTDLHMSEDKFTLLVEIFGRAEASVQHSVDQDWALKESME